MYLAQDGQSHVQSANYKGEFRSSWENAKTKTKLLYLACFLAHTAPTGVCFKNHVQAIILKIQTPQTEMCCIHF